MKYNELPEKKKWLLITILPDKTIRYVVYLLIILYWIVFSFIWQGSRFTSKDWMILYKVCSSEWRVSKEDILILYWQEQSDFKNFLLNNMQ